MKVVNQKGKGDLFENILQSISSPTGQTAGGALIGAAIPVAARGSQLGQIDPETGKPLVGAGRLGLEMLAGALGGGMMLKGMHSKPDFLDNLIGQATGKPKDYTSQMRRDTVGNLANKHLENPAQGPMGYANTYKYMYDTHPGIVNSLTANNLGLITLGGALGAAGAGGVSNLMNTVGIPGMQDTSEDQNMKKVNQILYNQNQVR